MKIIHVAAEPEFQESTSYVRSYGPSVNKLQLILRRFQFHSSMLQVWSRIDIGVLTLGMVDLLFKKILMAAKKKKSSAVLKHYACTRVYLACTCTST